MPFLLLLLLTVACLPVRWWPPPGWLERLGTYVLQLLGSDAQQTSLASALGSALVTWLTVFFVTGAAAAHAWRMKRLLKWAPEMRSTMLHRHAAWRFYHLVALFFFYGLALYVL